MSQFAFFPPSSGIANLSVGLNGAPAPTSSTEIGFINISGNETAVSPTTPLPTTVTNFPSEQNVNLNEVGGVAFALGQNTAAMSLSIVIASDQIGILATSANQTTQIGYETTTASNTTSILANQTNGTQVTSVNNFPAVQPVSGTVTANQGTAGASEWLVTDATTHTDLGTINTTLGSPMQQTGGTVTVIQPTAANLNATIVGSGAAGTPATGVVTIQGITGGTPIPVSPSNPPLPATVFTGQKTSAGTAVAISTTQVLMEGVLVQALSTNVGSVFVGASTVTTSNGMELQPGQCTSFAVNNLDAIYVISVTSGDGICYGGS